jgi:hypothetical protein
MSAVVRAVTASPGFIFLESTDELSSATIGEPSASEAFSCGFSAESEGVAEAELGGCAPACACVWHAAEPVKTSAPKIMNAVRFIQKPPTTADDLRLEIPLGTEGHSGPSS